MLLFHCWKNWLKPEAKCYILAWRRSIQNLFHRPNSREKVRIGSSILEFISMCLNLKSENWFNGERKLKQSFWTKSKSVFFMHSSSLSLFLIDQIDVKKANGIKEILMTTSHCTQVNIAIWARYRWPLVAVDRWSLFIGSFIVIFLWRDLVWSLLTGCR